LESITAIFSKVPIPRYVHLADLMRQRIV